MVTCCFRLLFLLAVLGASQGQIKRIRFKGNRTFSNSRLAEVIYTTRNQTYTSSKVAVDSAELVRFYRSQGFPQAEVRTVYTTNRGRLTFYLEENTRLKIGEINVIGVTPTDERGILSVIPLKKKSPLTTYGLSETERLTARYFKNQGYPYVVVDADTAIVEEGKVILSVSVIPGKRAWISVISFTGVDPSRVNPDFLMRTTRLEPGDLYSAKELDRASRLLYSTSLFSQVRTELSTSASEREDSLEVNFQLALAKTRVVTLGGGIQTDENAFIPDRLLLSAGWEHLNLFCRGISLSTELKLSPRFNGDYEVNLDLHNRYPSFLPWGLTIILSPYARHSLRCDSLYTLTTYVLGTEAGLEKDVSEKVRAGLSVQFKRAWQFADGEPYVSIEEARQTNFIRATMVYDSRDDFLDPGSGVFLYPYLDWAGMPLGGYNHFARASMDFRNFLALPFNSVLAWRLRAGLMRPHSGSSIEDISLSEKFSLGGSGTIRALRDRALGPDSIQTRSPWNPFSFGSDTPYIYDHYGTTSLLYNLEIRTPYFIKNLVGFALFLDAGLCTHRLDELRDEDWGWGPGIGIRIKTPLGPVRIDYAKNAKRPYSIDPDSLYIGRLELGFLQAF